MFDVSNFYDIDTVLSNICGCLVKVANMDVCELETILRQVVPASRLDYPSHKKL